MAKKGAGGAVAQQQAAKPGSKSTGGGPKKALTGRQKAAIFIITLGHDISSERAFFVSASTDSELPFWISSAISSKIFIPSSLAKKDLGKGFQSFLD